MEELNLSGMQQKIYNPAYFLYRHCFLVCGDMNSFLLTPWILMNPSLQPLVIRSSLPCWTVPSDCEPNKPIFLYVAPPQADGQAMKKVTPACGVLLPSTHSLGNAWAFLWKEALPTPVPWGCYCRCIEHGLMRRSPGGSGRT